MSAPSKRMLGIDVLTAARLRISKTFDDFPRICVSFSGGKDSTVMLHLVMEEAVKRNRKVGLFFLDWEAQYKITIAHVQRCFNLYADHIDPFWVTLPFTTVNAVSQFEPEWICWEHGKETIWVRERPPMTISDESFFPFYSYPMTFEEFVPEFGRWYGQGKATAIMVGIRAGESLLRWRTVTNAHKHMYANRQWTTWVGDGVYNVYPIYDWQTADIWRYSGKTAKPQNGLYDLMYRAGVPLHNQRICEPYGNEQRRGLWLFHVIEPDTWGRIVARVNGANTGALYSGERGSVMGNGRVTKPDGHSWESYTMLLLGSMPKKTSEHYKNKIAVYLKWYRDRGYPNGIPDCFDGDTAQKALPSWRIVCKVLLKNDYWCKGLCFSPTKQKSYANYLRIMKNRRQKWGIWN